MEPTFVWRKEENKINRPIYSLIDGDRLLPRKTKLVSWSLWVHIQEEVTGTERNQEVEIHCES